jgi:hypothetical protein
MDIGVILGIIIFVVVLVVEFFPIPIFKQWGLRLTRHQLGSKLMVAFLACFIVFILFTAKVPHPTQKIPIIIAALLLIWGNLFLKVGNSEEPREEDKEKTGSDEG